MAAPIRHASWSLRKCLWKGIIQTSPHRPYGRRTYLTANRNILKLKERGIFENLFPPNRTSELRNAVIGSPQCVYCGFDPTADSLHVGNLLALMALIHCQRAGHQAIIVLGGATAQIGDPSGKTTERDSIVLQLVEQNIKSIEQSIIAIFENHMKYFSQNSKDMLPVIMLNNAEWYAKRNVIEFLSTVGRHFRMGQLLGRHSVKSRLESPEGLNFTEFSYQIFQSYDWLHLFKNYNCKIQIGGNDQIGNITAGYELIQRVKRKDVFGLTVPLITTTSGEKFGKSANDAIWLLSKKTSPFEFYQFFVRLNDAEVERFLRLYTFLSEDEISHIMTKHKQNPENWGAQKKLASEVTKLVHGEKGLHVAKQCTKLLYENSTEALVSLSVEDLETLFSNAPTSELILDPGTMVRDLLLKANCFNRQEDADRIVRAGGVYINQQRETNPDAVLLPGQHILTNNLTLIRIGKKKYHLVKWFC